MENNIVSSAKCGRKVNFNALYEGEVVRENFASEEEAWSYVYGRMCDICQWDRKRALAGEADVFAEAIPVCAKKWMIVEVADIVEAQLLTGTAA